MRCPIPPFGVPLPAFEHPALPVLGRRLAEVRRRGSARILMMGAPSFSVRGGHHVTVPNPHHEALRALSSC